MNYLSRTLESAWTEAAKQFPALLLTGPRQVGKTTLLRHLCDAGRSYVTLDDIGLRALANEDPRLFLQRFGPPVLIDEIQYAPNLFPFIKMDVDRRQQPGAYWLTGSQQFRLMANVTESLAGRIAILDLLGLSLQEIQCHGKQASPFLPSGQPKINASTDLTDINSVFARIWLGSYPALAAGEVSHRDLFYSSYLQTYLERDVRDLLRVGNQNAFLRFLRACAAGTGQLLNVAGLARVADVTPATANQWLSILEASRIVFLLPPYHSNLSKRLVKRPKLHFLDTGLCAYLTQWSSPQTLSSGAMAGHIFESFVFAEILKSWWHNGLNPNIFFYRDRDQREIDLLIERDGQLYPLEIKLGATPNRSWTRTFGSLDHLTVPWQHGNVICLSPDILPLSQKVTAVPVSVI